MVTDKARHNRWLVAIMGTILMIVLGTVYAWSFFQKPIVETYGWSNSGVAWVFSTNILFLGLAAAWGGVKLSKYGPTRLAIIGAAMYGVGFILGALALKLHSLPFLIAGFGVVGGSGIGLGYVTPVVSASKWFPDKQGFVTGMVVMGFGFGALVMSKLIAPTVLKIADHNLVLSFLIIGIIILLLGVVAALFIKQPPAGYFPQGYSQSNNSRAHAKTDNENEMPVEPATASFAPLAVASQITAKEAIFTSKFMMMWLIFFINITAGIMFISFQSPLMQDLWSRFKPAATPEALAAIGATLIAISSLFNGAGRFFWGGLSDKIGRIQTFRLIMGSQVVVFLLLLVVNSPYIFAALVCYVLLCYGGGFGTVPSFVREVFTERLMPVVYGMILTAWSAGGVLGPQIVGLMKDNYPDKASTFSFITGVALLAIGFVFTLILNNKPIHTSK